MFKNAIIIENIEYLFFQKNSKNLYSITTSKIMRINKRESGLLIIPWIKCEYDL